LSAKKTKAGVAWVDQKRTAETETAKKESQYPRECKE